MNQVNLIGNLGRDPTLRTTGSGRDVCNFSLAVDRYYYTGAPGQRTRQKQTDWIPVVVWGNNARVCAQYLKTGSKVCVTGSLRPRTYEDEHGVTHHVFDVHADNVQFLSGIRSGAPEVIEEPPAAEE